MTGATKLFALLGCIGAATAVMLGAFAAHGLKSRLAPELLNAFQTGVQYHFYHALGLFAVALVASQLQDSNLARWAGWAMCGGIVLFSGSLYALTLTGIKGLGAVTPLGGIAFVAAWCLLALAVLRG